MVAEKDLRGSWLVARGSQLAARNSQLAARGSGLGAEDSKLKTQNSELTTVMSIVVQKYGGSSVADVDKIRAVAARVMETSRAGHDVVVVVSAMGDTTDELIALARKVSANPERRELDMLLSVGERISMALLSIAIRELGGDAISFTGSQSGIITNDRHVDARIIEVRPFRVQDELARGRVVVIAGYQGVSYAREVTTLGRGGSDTTAVAMAAALGADWCEICSDVAGVYTADPRVVPEATRIPALSYEETQELAESGAKVLNAQAVEFAKKLKDERRPSLRSSSANVEGAISLFKSAHTYQEDAICVVQSSSRKRFSMYWRKGGGPSRPCSRPTTPIT